MKRYIKKLISGMLAFSIFTSTLITSQAATDVNVSVNINPKIDIMLTSKDTNLDLSNFESDVKTNLQNKGISANNIQFQTVESGAISSNKADASVVFSNWTKFGNAGKWSLTKYSGSNVIYNAENTWGVTGYYPFDVTNLKDMTVEYDFMPADTDNDFVGIILRFNMEDDLTNTTKPLNTKVSGYWYWECNQKGQAQAWINNCGLYKVENGFLGKDSDNSSQNKGGLSTNATSPGVSPWSSQAGVSCLVKPASNQSWSSYNAWTHYKFKIEGSTITIWRNGTEVLSYTDESGTPITTGSFALINMSQASRYRNFEWDYTYYKTYKEILTQPTWRDDAKHIVVNVDNNTDETLTGDATIGEILSRTLADDIHFIQWGTNTNKSASETFISRNDNKGLFIDNSNYNNAVDQTTDYIIGLIEQESSEQYITVGQDISFSVDPAEYKTNATSTDYPNGRWKINHEYKYFANNQGQSSESGVPTSDLNFNFDKPGKYNILFDDKLVKEIYVHRKPVADFTIEIGENNSLKLMSTSYDLDSNEDKGYGAGIAEENWYYKEASASTWTEGKLTKFDKTKIYVIKLEVKDYQGASAYTTKYTGTGNPVSNFNYANDVVSKYKPLIVNNSSYDPEGYEIVEQNWVLKKDGVVVSESSEPITDFNIDGLGEGNYTYTLTVKNSQGTVSESFTKSFTIEEDYGKPEVAIGQQGCNWKHSQAVSLEFSDNESEFKNWRYAFTTSPVAPATDEEWSDWSEETDTTIQLADVSGKYYLHIQAYDIASNELTRAVGTYNLDNTDPVINDVKTQKDEINKTFIKVEATDEHSGIVGYAITKAEPMTFNLRTRNTNLEVPTEFQESNILEVTDNGTYNVWVKDSTGNVTVTTYTIEDVNYIGKNTTVYAEVGCEFKVTIPKHIILSGTTKTGAYTVSVEGDIAGTDKIKVVPDESFALSSTNLNDVTATIEQDKTEWSYDQILNDEFKVIGNGSIDAKDITAGSWNGNFNFNIALEGDKIYKNSEPFVEYMDILYNYEASENN